MEAPHGCLILLLNTFPFLSPIPERCAGCIFCYTLPMIKQTKKTQASKKSSPKPKVGYVDGYVLVVPTAKNEAYRQMAKEGAKAWMQAGALGYYECQADDLSTMGEGGQSTMSFEQLTNLKAGETVWYSFIHYRSRAHRDAVNKKVHKAMEQQADKYKDFVMPFDMQRMAFGGFKVMVGE